MNKVEQEKRVQPVFLSATPLGAEAATDGDKLASSYLCKFH